MRHKRASKYPIKQPRPGSYPVRSCPIYRRALLMARQIVRATPTTATAVIAGGIISAAAATDIARNIVCTARLADVADRIVAAPALTNVACRIVRAAPRLRRACGGDRCSGGQR